MRKLHFIMLAPSLVLTACINGPQATSSQYTAPGAGAGGYQPQPVQTVSTQNLDAPSSPQDNLCPSDEYSGLVGRKYQDVPEEQLPPYFRTLKPGQNLVMSQPARVNLYLDNRGVVSSVRCG